MKKIFGLALFALLATLAFFGNTANASTGCMQWGTCSVTTQVSVNLTGGNICIWSSGNFGFGQYTVSSLSQTVTGAFVGVNSYFFVDDQKGIDTGYYTTVQMSGHLVSNNGSVISGQNVYMMTSTTPVLIAWRDNPRVIIHAGMASFQSLDSARQLINRNAAANAGLTSKYGTLPTMQLVIPAYTPVGTYTGTLVYSLYEN